jgi:probable phosphoglycerate mutase
VAELQQHHPVHRRRLRDDDIAAVYCSPLRRTRDTAALIAAPHGLTPLEHPGLREIDHGHWEGLRRTDVESQFLEEYAAWEADPFSVLRNRSRPKTLL